MTALESGQLDAVILPVPFGPIQFAKGYTNLLDATDYDFARTYPNTWAVVREDWARENPDHVVRYLRGQLRTQEWIYSHRDEFIARVAELVQIPPEHAAIGWEVYTGKGIFARDARPAVAGLEDMLRDLASENSFPSDSPPRATDQIDLSYLDRARAGLGL